MSYCRVERKQCSPGLKGCPECELEVKKTEKDNSKKEINNREEIDQNDLVELYKSYSRVNTDFLKEALDSEEIPYKCILKGGLLGRGGSLNVGIFQPSNEDAIFYVLKKNLEHAQQIKIRTVGEN